MNVARREMHTLFATFLDVCKAYDVISRDTLFLILNRVVCGMLIWAVLLATLSQ